MPHRTLWPNLIPPVMLSGQVLMKDIVTAVALEEVRNVIKKSLENAALVNYTKISETTRVEGNSTYLNLNHL